MTRRKLKTWLIVLACGGSPLITSATCDPYSGVLDFYRDDDAYYYDDWYYDDYHVADCLLFPFFCF